LKLFIATVVALTALVVTSSAAAAVFTIRGDWKMGSFAVKEDGKLRGAVDAFGKPSAKVRNGEVCTVRWSQHGLRIVFYNLGGTTRAGGGTDSSRTRGRRARTGRRTEAWRSGTARAA